MPAPASALGIFKPAFDPTTHTVPDGGGLFWCQISHDQPHFLIAFIPTSQQGASQAADLPRKTVHLPTPGTAHLWGSRGQTAKGALSLRTEIALLVDAHERVPPQRHDLGIQPGGIQAAIAHHDHRPVLRYTLRQLLEQLEPMRFPGSLL